MYTPYIWNHKDTLINQDREFPCKQTWHTYVNKPCNLFSVLPQAQTLFRLFPNWASQA